jgi:hypothetical protein
VRAPGCRMRTWLPGPMITGRAARMAPAAIHLHPTPGDGVAHPSVGRNRAPSPPRRRHLSTPTNATFLPSWRKSSFRMRHLLLACRASARPEGEDKITTPEARCAERPMRRSGGVNDGAGAPTALGSAGTRREAPSGRDLAEGERRQGVPRCGAVQRGIRCILPRTGRCPRAGREGDEEQLRPVHDRPGLCPRRRRSDARQPSPARGSSRAPRTLPSALRQLPHSITNRTFVRSRLHRS